MYSREKHTWLSRAKRAGLSKARLRAGSGQGHSWAHRLQRAWPKCQHVITETRTAHYTEAGMAAAGLGIVLT